MHHPLPYRFIPAAGDSPAGSGSCLGGIEVLLWFVLLSLEAGKRSCGTAAV